MKIPSLYVFGRGVSIIVVEWWTGLPVATILLSKKLELTYKAIIGVNNLSPRLHKPVGLLIAHFLVLNQVGQHETH